MYKLLFFILIFILSIEISTNPPIPYPDIKTARNKWKTQNSPPIPPPYPGIAALLGIFPGAGHLYLGDYTTAGVQMGGYFAFSALQSHFSSQKDYIPWKDRKVEFSTDDVLLGYAFQREGMTYTNSFVAFPGRENLGIIETAFERDLRLYKEGKIAEQNTFLKYGDYTRTNRNTYFSDTLSNPVLSLSLYSIYSAYRDAGGLGEYKKSESIGDLAYSPFNFQILKLPYVYIPMILMSFLAGSDRISPDGSDPILAPRSLIKDGSLYGGAFITGISPAIGEEAFFRGYLNQRLTMSGLGPYWGLGSSSLLFMLAHEGNDDAREGRLSRLIGGIYLGYVHLLYGYDIRPSIALHFWWNFILGISQISRYVADPNYDKSQREVFFMPITYTLQIK